MWNINEFAAITIRMASPDRVREWSHGEVKKPETINYRTLKPELEGLFCERIFGSTKDWECYCGKFKSIRYKGVVCDRCQVEVTHSKVRRERMGHIDLAAPVSHIWYFKGIPSKLGILLDMTIKELDRVLYFQEYVVIDAGDTPLKKKDLLSEEQYREAVERYGNRFKAGMGAESVRELLVQLDLNQIRQELRESLALKQSKADERTLVRKLELVEAFISSRNKPEWMILAVLPVIPPELRPMVQLDGGRFATSDLNDLYRRVLNRNNRLRRLIDLKAPSIIIRNEKRMLQESVDALLDNGRRGRAVKSASNNRVLKSLSDMLKGKQGRFRQNLLGKRVDYSGRSVIVVGPELKLNQCGLPKRMALELFKPFIMKALVMRNLASNIKAAKKMVEQERPEVWEVIEDVIADHPVLLNRAPTLHRLGIQAFLPTLVEGKAIRLHPLVCVAFNADFDGDQMAVHVPLSTEAVVESRLLMMADRNILSPASGRPIITPTQDIVLGIYYLTKEKESAAALERIFSNAEECLFAFETGSLSLHARVRVRYTKSSKEKPKIIETTPGRLILNADLPEAFEYVNRTISKSALGKLFDDIYRKFGETVMAQIADRIKRLGFIYSSRSGISIGIDDMRVPAQKQQLLQIARDEVAKINEQYKNGVITEQERYTKIIELWTNTTEEVAKVMFDEIELSDEGFNPIYIMADSGARGSKAQIKQLAGMRGLMADPFGRIRETPIESNFREGLSVLEFFQSTTGARKGLTDTALKTANAGYLTRRLVDVAQDVVIYEEDCGTTRGLIVTHRRTGDEIVEPLHKRVLGRFFAEDVADPRDGAKGKIIFKAGTIIDESVQPLLEESGLEELKIRSTLTCESKKGVCRKCYGRDLATGRLVEIGEAVGVVAAQSIGEPGTQLTLRTFHVGGTASADDTYLRARFTGEITSLPRTKKQEDGTVFIVDNGSYKGHRIERYEIVPKAAVIHTNSRGTRIQQPIKTHFRVKIAVKDGATVAANQEIVAVEVASIESCKVKSVRKDGLILTTSTKKDRRLDIPGGLTIVVKEGEKVESGEPLARRVFTTPFPAKVKLGARRGGGDLVTVTSTAEENISAVKEKGVLIEAEAMVGAEPKVEKGMLVEIEDIIGVNPGFNPVIAPLSGRIEFEKVELQKEGNEHIVIKPESARDDEQAALVVWKGVEMVVGPDETLKVKSGQSVETGAAISSGQTSPIKGTAHIVRTFQAKDGAAVGYVVRVVESGEKRTLPYLRYTRTSAGTQKSKALSKVKKQNIKLISKSHVVLHELYRKFAIAQSAIEKHVTENRGVAAETTLKSELFTPSEYIFPTQKAVKTICDFEQHALKSRNNFQVEEGMLVVKIFSDFLRGAKEGQGDKKGTAMDITGGLPRVEELFELRKPKSTPAIIAPVDGKVVLGPKFRKDRIVIIKGVDGAEEEVSIPTERYVTVDDDQEVAAGELITDGPVEVRDLLGVRSESDVQQYIVDEVQAVYRAQGVEINDKHIEVIVRQMMRKIRITSSGDTEFLKEGLVDRQRLADENDRVKKAGKRPATFQPVLLGITKAAKFSDSFISAASFQETTWALTNAALSGKSDKLRGLKENVIIGHLIPAGTGMKIYRDREALRLEDEAGEPLGVYVAPAAPPGAPSSPFPESKEKANPLG